MNYSIFPFDEGPPIGHTAGRNVRVAPVCIPGADKPYGVVLTPILPETLAAASCLSGAAVAL